MDQVSPAIMALAISSAFLVKGDVDILRGILGEKKSRRWALPVFGLVVAFTIVGLNVAFATVGGTYANVAGVCLAGNLAYLLAAGQTAQHRAVREN